jgi:antitoxin Phd
MAAWQVQEAKAQLSKLIELACTKGVQTITHHGRERAVLLSIEDYKKLLEHKPDFKAYLLGGPKVTDFTIKRNRDTGRTVKL